MDDLPHSPDCPHSTHSVRREIERLKNRIEELQAELERQRICLKRGHGPDCVMGREVPDE